MIETRSNMGTFGEEPMREARFPIHAQWHVPDLEVERRILSFVHRTSLMPGINRVELVGPGGILDRFTVSASAPTVKLLSPLNNATVNAASGKIALRWSGSDPDNDPLVYSVYYSPDNGKKWRSRLCSEAKKQKIQKSGQCREIVIHLNFNIKDMEMPKC